MPRAFPRASDRAPERQPAPGPAARRSGPEGVRAEFEFLCEDPQVHRRVKDESRLMGFKRVEDAPEHSEYDVVADTSLKGEEYKSEVIDMLMEKLQDDVYSVQITSWD